MRGYAWGMLGLLMAAPVSAQIAGSYHTRPSQLPFRPDYELGQIRQSIDDGRDNGQLSRRQAKRLRRDAGAVAAAEARAGDRISDAEREQFEARREYLRGQVAAGKIRQRP
ncbi:hypothetical protein [Sphingomonas sp.]|uniref:hypothetical protein n=1 Tax=Sphingomonas sp. TaxID=28214 RepID=UPI0025EF77C2|nr:hypothetical protein [Sphingomonas sp.]